MTSFPIIDEGRTAEVRSIVDMLREILDRIVAGYEQAGVLLPSRQYTTTGTPAIDCAQLVVIFRQAYVGPVGDEASDPQRCDGPRTAVLEVQVSRCVPGPKGPRATAPSAEAIQEAAELQMQDAWLLLDLAPSTDVWNGMAPGGPGVIATVEAGEPQGAFQTTVLQLTMQIP